MFCLFFCICEMLPTLSGAPTESCRSTKTEEQHAQMQGRMKNTDLAGVNVISVTQQVLIQIYRGRKYILQSDEQNEGVRIPNQEGQICMTVNI